MEINDAWQQFCSSGKIEDYLKYKNIQNGGIDNESNFGSGAGNKSS